MFAGKVAVVTGASRGIGRAVAVDLVKQGADVAVIGRDAAALDETLAACRTARVEARVAPYVADVTDEAANAAAVAQIVAEFGRLDIAVANAGQSIDGLMLRFKGADLDPHFFCPPPWPGRWSSSAVVRSSSSRVSSASPGVPARPRIARPKRVCLV
jgi:NAD(P)-dependent dehydrogenase (short-subunit alcohol dehydrogenase family)